MVAIHGLPQPISRPSDRTSHSQPSVEADNGRNQTIVARAVSKGLKNPEMAGDAYQQIHYDRPDGRGQNALASYHDVQNQAKREQLEDLFGVDIYV
ncbi:chromosome segregation ATPase [Veronia pacifica]|uniref:Chromosome segregation ATPase n=1 Tax=Veronia pacifica TaxID=1080227 RepID=A0A1C3ERK9_9GAMM|nr:chromosome segregation ATPase [Veronia pacifica]ODA35854.1 chromosome segregation ATPase [Veronia pacifica]